jgi:hypothetical protein
MPSRTWTYEHTLETQASADSIWRLWADVASWSRWDADIEWARLEGPFATGSRGRMKPRGVPAAAFTLVSVLPGVSYTVEQRVPLARLRFHHELAAADADRTRLTHGVTIDGSLGPFYAFLFGGRMRANFPKITNDLAEMALAPPSAGASEPSPRSALGA